MVFWEEVSHPQEMGHSNDSDSACLTNPAHLALVEMAALWVRHMKRHWFFLDGHGQVGFGEHTWSPVHLCQTVCTFLIWTAFADCLLRTHFLLLLG